MKESLQQALFVREKTPVELVITDIKMPRMDGLQLIQRLQEKYPRIRTAVLSSYDDFAFAKIALRYGSLDYILKAEMTVKDLSQLLDKVQNDFRVEHSLASGLSPDYRRISAAQKAVADFLASQISLEDLQENLSLSLRFSAFIQQEIPNIDRHIGNCNNLPIAVAQTQVNQLKQGISGYNSTAADPLVNTAAQKIKASAEARRVAVDGFLQTLVSLYPNRFNWDREKEAINQVSFDIQEMHQNSKEFFEN